MWDKACEKGDGRRKGRRGGEVDEMLGEGGVGGRRGKGDGIRHGRRGGGTKER